MCTVTCGWGPWGNWGTCTGASGCSANSTDTDTQTCGHCPTGIQTRTRTCSTTCGWGPWGGWGGCSGTYCENGVPCCPCTQLPNCP
jgi:hypothetical protein